MASQNGYGEEGGNVPGNAHGKRILRPIANAADSRHDMSMLELLVYLITCGSCLTLLAGDLLKPL
jgi:hypothetical protein